MSFSVPRSLTSAFRIADNCDEEMLRQRAECVLFEGNFMACCVNTCLVNCVPHDRFNGETWVETWSGGFVALFTWVQ